MYIYVLHKCMLICHVGNEPPRPMCTERTSHASVNRDVYGSLVFVTERLLHRQRLRCSYRVVARCISLTER